MRFATLAIPLLALMASGCAAGMAQYAALAPGIPHMGRAIVNEYGLDRSTKASSSGGSYHLIDVAWNGFGLSIPSSDAAASERAITSALRPGSKGQTFSWKNAKNGDSGSFLVTSERLHEDGFRCHQLDQKIILSGQTTSGSTGICVKNGQYRVDR